MTRLAVTLVVLVLAWARSVRIARRRMADAADTHHRALDRWRCRRHVRAPALRPLRGNLPRALLRREPGGRRRSIGTAATAQAAPDGHTLTTSSTAYHVIAPLVSATPGFDPIRDFTHIAYIGGPPNVFVANPALAVRSLEDLVALGRRGQPIDYVSPGVGTLGHLLAEAFARRSGIRLQQIMTKGASQALMDLVAGTVNVGTMTWTSALGQIRAGKVVPIAVSSQARVAEFPDLPTFGEQGYDELTAVSWFALSGPAGCPPTSRTSSTGRSPRCWRSPRCASGWSATRSRRVS